MTKKQIAFVTLNLAALSYTIFSGMVFAETHTMWHPWLALAMANCAMVTAYVLRASYMHNPGGRWFTKNLTQDEVDLVESYRRGSND